MFASEHITDNRLARLSLSLRVSMSFNYEKLRLHLLLSYERGKAEQLPESPIDWITHPLGRFFKIEAAAGIMLLVFTLLALFLANSSFSAQYFSLWETPIGVTVGSVVLERDVHAWINDGLMTLFFFLIALELKRELVLGELRKPKLAILSVSGAIGGMLVPAFVYLLFQFGEVGQDGWGTVMATDTAFVVGCLALMGRRVPKSLRVFMLSLAIVDDLGAIIVVAVGYGSDINFWYLSCALVGFIVVKCMTMLGVRSIVLFVVAGIVLWLLVDASGVHPTVVGVLLGLMTPTTKWVSDSRLHDIVNTLSRPSESSNSKERMAHTKLLRTAEAAAREAMSPVERLEFVLHPWVGFVVMPLFAFANAGVSFTAQGMSAAIAVSVFFGFVIGKPAGICLFSWVAVRAKLAERPSDLSWGEIFAGGILAGIGFTMAIFIANLAFTPEHVDAAKLGILTASLFSSLLGTTVLFFITRKNSEPITQSALR